MKKSAKISLIAGALAITTCVGALALAGCDKSSSDSWSDMSATTYSAFASYINTYNMNFDVNYDGIRVTKSTSDGAYHTDYTLDLKISGGKTYAHFKIDANVALSGGNSTLIKGDTYLIEDILFIDNGTIKYSVGYRGREYANASDETLSDEHKLLSKYLYNAIDNATNKEKPYDANKTLTTVRSRLEKSMIFTKTDGDTKYFKVDYEDIASLSDSQKKTTETFKIKFNGETIQSFEISSSSNYNSTETSSLLKYERFTGTINLPSKQENWPAKAY